MKKYISKIFTKQSTKLMQDKPDFNREDFGDHLTDNHVFGNTENDIIFLNGVLSAFQYINHKADSGFSFSLAAFPKIEDSVEKTLQHRYETESAITLYPVALHEVKEKLYNWLFSFIVETNNGSREAYLEDKEKAFSISDKTDRIDFVNEFVFFLNKTINPVNIFHINEINTRFYFGITYDKIYFETKDKIYSLHLSWSD